MKFWRFCNSYIHSYFMSYNAAQQGLATDIRYAKKLIRCHHSEDQLMIRFSGSGSGASICKEWVGNVYFCYIHDLRRMKHFQIQYYNVNFTSFHILNYREVSKKHRKNCESYPSQLIWDIKFKCQFCLSCLSCPWHE